MLYKAKAFSLSHMLFTYLSSPLLFLKQMHFQFASYFNLTGLSDHVLEATLDYFILHLEQLALKTVCI